MTDSYSPVARLEESDYDALYQLVEESLSEERDPITSISFVPPASWTRAKNPPIFSASPAVIDTASRDASAAAAVPTGEQAAARHDNPGTILGIRPGALIYTVAGTTVPPPGTLATNWAISSPGKTALDSSGNLYVIDRGMHSIYQVSRSGIITLFSGNGWAGYSGDGGPAVDAQLNYPEGMAIDGAGNTYIADYDNHRIRKVDTSGIITTVVGNGKLGYAGDGGAATSATLYYPSSVTIDGAGNLYIADTFNFRIRKVDTSGIITTVAGNGTQGYSGDGGVATSAQLRVLSDVAVGSNGDLFIAESIDNRIRKVDTSGIITTVAGNGKAGYSGDGGSATSAQLYQPSGVTVDGEGNLYIADNFNHRVRKVDTAGIITTVAGDGSVGYYKVDRAGVIIKVTDGISGYSGDGGLATSAQLLNPAKVTVDGTGNLYIADGNNHRIRKVDRAGIITTVAGNGKLGYSGDGGPATGAQLYGSSGITIDDKGNLYIADGSSRIHKVDGAGIITTVAGNGKLGYSGDGGPATSAQLSRPAGVVVDSSGCLYIADTHNCRIRKIDTAGVITTVAGNGTWGYSGDGGLAIIAQLYNPAGMAVDSGGNLYIADAFNNR
ncbi:MAG: hypothetical protein HY692_06865, partial [Cyanobacteria bacterium NC_groundwater_1444_Ag_S-0.65um_54_12]|nr:hypothetical protein [Cyanobacteria bacterium NC_groundwater_1444_Ag_S-0.65um_54_12]